MIDSEELEDDRPPVLGSWKNVYTVVLILHLLLIMSFYFISRHFTY